MMGQLLIIDNDAEFCDLLSRYLTTEGFDTLFSHNAKEGLHILDTHNVQVIILELMQPDLNGFDLLKKIRVKSQVPVLMLTASHNAIDKIIGLEIGADDYLTKPCNPRELLARIKAIIRRTSKVSTSNGNKITVGPLTLNPLKHSIYINNTPLELTNAEYNILKILISYPEKAFSKETLTEQALNRKHTAFDRSIDVHISNIRNKLSEFSPEEPLIQTVRGFGYMFSEIKNPQ